MPGRTVPFVNGGFYHIYNRGSDKRDIFKQTRDYKRFIQAFYYYQFPGPKAKFSNFNKSNLNSLNLGSTEKYVDVICFCLMPNHFHFLVRQLNDGGISVFLSQLSNSYTRYFNTKYSRVGPLLQGAFKAVLVESEAQLIHLSRYIHINPVVSGLTKDLPGYKWSSYPEFSVGQGKLCVVEPVLNIFSSPLKYAQFVRDHIDYGTTLEVIKHQLIKDDI